MIAPFLQRLMDLVLPPGPSCVGCGKSIPSFAFPLCPPCRANLPIVVPPLCDLCGKPIRREGTLLCLDCSNVSHVFKKNVALGLYEGTLREMIQGLKYRQRREVAKPLGHLMAKAFKRTGLQVHGVIPVPLHPMRLLQRGYNQAELLGLAVAQTLGVAYLPVLRRVRETRFQSGLSPKARRENLQGAFSATDTWRIRGKNLLVVDDIYTTGSTLDAVSGILLRAGALKVYGLCAAVAVRDRDWA